MKLLSLLLILTCFSIKGNTQVVEVLMTKSNIKSGEIAHFEVRCLSEQNLEITVFTEGHLLFQQNAILPPATYPFDCKTESAPTGKYFILITGNGIHIEKEFTLSN